MFRKGMEGKINALVSICTTFTTLLPQADANRHVASGLLVLTGSNGITEGMLKESGERGERRWFPHVCKNC